MNIPTQLTVARFLLALVGILLLANARSSFHILASTTLYIIATATDVLDGFLARRMGCTTKSGALMDSTADNTLFLLYFFYLQRFGVYPPWLFAIMLTGHIARLGALSFAIQDQKTFKAFYGEKHYAPLSYASLACGLLSLLQTNLTMHLRIAAQILMISRLAIAGIYCLSSLPTLTRAWKKMCTE